MATVTKIIDSYGTPGVNCDFTTIGDWAGFVASQTNPDQVGIVRGEHSESGVNLGAFTAFTTPTTQDTCPRLIGDPSWQAGYAFYSGTTPSDVPFLYGLNIYAPFAGGNACHFKVQGLQTYSLAIDFSATDSATGSIWLDSVCVGVQTQISGSAYLETISTAVRFLFTNCLFIGDGGPDCFYFYESLASGLVSIAFVNSVLAKAVYVNWGGNSSLYAYVINSVEMSKEGYGFSTNTPQLTVAGNASYPPNESSEQLSPVFTLDDSEYNYGIFLDSSYYGSDYRLPANSLLIDLGVTPVVPGWDLTSLKDVMGTVRPRGSAFDIGLYEYPSAILETSGLLLCF